MFQIEDSGKRESFGTGAVRDPEDGKLRLDLIFKYLPMEALVRVAEHYDKGALKYQADNWRKGIPVSRCFSSALRHLYQFGEGRSDEDHLAAVIFNVLAIIQYQEVGPSSVVDFPKKFVEKTLDKSRNAE